MSEEDSIFDSIDLIECYIEVSEIYLTIEKLDSVVQDTNNDGLKAVYSGKAFIAAYSTFNKNLILYSLKMAIDAYTEVVNNRKISGPFSHTAVLIIEELNKEYGKFKNM